MDFSPTFQRVWEPYAAAALKGGLRLQSGYATEPLRTGDAIVSVASSAGVLYYSDTVTYPDNTSEKVEIVAMPCPVFEGGEELVMQRGVGMCTVKSTPEREQTCMTFLRWLTEPERNTEFVTALGYVPVTQEAFDDYLPAAVEKLDDPMYRSLYETFIAMRQDYDFYTPPQLDDYLDMEPWAYRLMRGTWCQYGANLRKNEKMVRCVPVVPAGVQKGRYDLIWHQKAKRKNAAIR